MDPKGLEFAETEEEQTCESEVAELCMTAKDALGDKVEKGVASNRITDSPVRCHVRVRSVVLRVCLQVLYYRPRYPITANPILYIKSGTRE